MHKMRERIYNKQKLELTHNVKSEHFEMQWIVDTFL